MYTIYKITNKINGKIYIGQTIHTVEERVQRHLRDALLYNINTHFYKAIKKYGMESFTYEAIDFAKTKQGANEKECFYIKTLDTTNHAIGYNSTPGGDGGNTYLNKTETELNQIKSKISKSNSGGNNGNSRKLKMKNIITNEIIFFDSGSDCLRYLQSQFGEIPDRIYFRHIKMANRYGIQGVFKNTYIFADIDKDFSRYSTYKINSGNCPVCGLNKNTGESFIGLCLEEVLDHFSLPRNITSHGYKKLNKLGFEITKIK